MNFYQNYDFAIFQKIGIFWGLTQAIVDCRMKRVTLRTPKKDEVTFIGERSNHLSNVIYVATARTMVQKGCETYLTYVIEMEKIRLSVSDIPTVSDFSDVFPEVARIASIEGD